MNTRPPPDYPELTRQLREARLGYTVETTASGILVESFPDRSQKWEFDHEGYLTGSNE